MTFGLPIVLIPMLNLLFIPPLNDDILSFATCVNATSARILSASTLDRSEVYPDDEERSTWLAYPSVWRISASVREE